MRLMILLHVVQISGGHNRFSDLVNYHTNSPSLLPVMVELSSFKIFEHFSGPLTQQSQTAVIRLAALVHDSIFDTMDTAFRKIDIDAFDEDVIHESELYEADPRDPSEVLDDAKQRQVAVRSLLAKCASLSAVFGLGYLGWSWC